jgi:lipid II:glycine glycyltransferase (peptidoglycan interpeptide bridge formation enzyme)
MLTDAHTSGAEVFDLRGISDTLDPDDPLFGLLRFKLGLGGDAVELAGEWEYVLRPARHRLVSAYRRSR